MRFSVLMSVYQKDDPSQLREALKSIYEDQIRKPEEIVVVFDGPLTDELYYVLREFAEDKTEVVRYYPQEINRGLGEALKIGSTYCTGDYILRMDSDDISHPERFEKQMAYVEAHPEIDVLGTDIAEFCESPNEKDLRVRSCPEQHEAIVRMGKKRNPMNHVSVCMKRSALEKSGGYESLLLLEDYYLWLKMIVSGSVFANMNESLVYVRVGNGFDHKRGDRVRINGWRVLQKFMCDNGMISHFGAWINMVEIRLFVWTPPKIKSFLYRKFLRK